MTYEELRTTIQLHLKNKEVGALKELLNQTEKEDLIEVFEELSMEEVGAAYRLLSKDNALFIFEQLDTDNQQELLASVTHEKAVEMITELEPDDRVRLLDELPAAVTKRLISGLSAEERQLTNLLLGYEEETAGRMMTPEYIRISKDMKISQALDKVRENGHDKETIYTLFVTDNERKLEGVVSLRDLFMATTQEEKVETLMHQNPYKATTDTDQEEAAKMLQDYALLALPVVDRENRLVGIITVDDAMDVLQEEMAEDLYIHAGLSDENNKESTRSKTLISGNIMQIWRVRLPILIIVLVFGFLSGMIMENFEEILASVTVIGFFVPLIMNMGGSVGGQSTTIFARGYALGQIKEGQFIKQLMKEGGVGLSIGSVIGFFSFFVVWFWVGEPMIALAVSLALVANCFIAAFFGYLVPFFLIKIGADQAAGSGPIITSIKDISGLITYFLLVSYLLGHLIY